MDQVYKPIDLGIQGLAKKCEIERTSYYAGQDEYSKSKAAAYRAIEILLYAVMNIGRVLFKDKPE